MTPHLESHPWPDSVDGFALLMFLAAALLAPVLGYVLTALDIWRYLHSLKRALVRVLGPGRIDPDWARPATPRSLVVFGLAFPCDEEDLKQAYRARIKQLHPDRGGDKRRFLALQAHFENALRLIAETNVQAADAEGET